MYPGGHILVKKECVIYAEKYIFVKTMFHVYKETYFSKKMFYVYEETSFSKIYLFIYGFATKMLRAKLSLRSNAHCFSGKEMRFGCNKEGHPDCVLEHKRIHNY